MVLYMVAADTQTDSPVHNVSPVMVVNSVGDGWRMWCMSFVLF